MIGLEYGQFDLTAVVMQSQSPAQFVEFYALTHQIECSRQTVHHSKLPSLSD